MSLDTYRSLVASGDPAASGYLNRHFETLFAEATDEFALYGRIAVGIAVAAGAGAFWMWVHFRSRLPWRMFWLIPLAALVAYASLKSAVVLELIRQAPDLPQMWSLYFKATTPLRMVRTPVSGLVALGLVMWVVAIGRWRLGQRRSHR